MSKLSDVEAVLKHLPGQHDQKSHAGEGYAGGPHAAATDFERVATIKFKKAGTPASKRRSSLFVRGDAVDSSAEALLGLGYVEGSGYDTKDRRGRSFHNGDIDAAVNFNKITKITGLEFTQA